jgi:hypothetical protein
MKKSKKLIILQDERRRVKKQKTNRVDLDPQTTEHRGVKGFYELLLRKFKTFMFLVTLAPVYCLGGLFIGVSLAPGILFYNWVAESVVENTIYTQALAKGLAIGVGFFFFGFTLILIVPFSNFVLRAKPSLFRGPYYSVDVLKWVVHNSLTYLVRYTFLEFITPTPFNILFFKMMGMKIGKATQINTSNISDPALIELGKYVTIGGSATLCAHYGQGGYLVLAPIKIGDKVTVGLRSSIMGGVTIGEGAKILPHSIVLPKTQIPAGETWGGVPAQKIILKKAA